MENFLKSVISALSFLSLLFFCFFSDSLTEESRRAPAQADPPSIKSVKFEQVPAMVDIGEKRHENEFDWQN